VGLRQTSSLKEVSLRTLSHRIGRRTFLAIAAAGLLSACSRTGSHEKAGYTVWGENGRRDGQFIRPRAILANGEDVYVIDTTGRVQVFTTDGLFKRSWSLPHSERGTPTGICVGRNANLLIPDTHYSRILEYTTAGQLLSTWGSYGIGDDRFIYPTGIVQTAGGLYYVSEYGIDAERVRVFDERKRPIRGWGSHGPSPGQFNRAMAIAFTETTGVYVSDTANHRIQRFDPQGRLIAVIGGPGDEPGRLKFPHNLAIATDGTVFVVEYGAHRVSRFSSEGSFIECYGGPGRDPGRFNGPRGISVSGSGQVFVADTDNHRIQRFDYRATT